MKKPKLTAGQNMQLKGLDLTKKLKLLHQWRKNKEISQEAFEHFSNAWINKDSKKENSLSALRVSPRENFDRDIPRSAVEGEIQNMIERLRGYTKEYICNRNMLVCELSEQDLAKFRKYVTTYFAVYPDKIARLLIIGLRYPDPTKRINQFCNEWIARDSLKLHKDYLTDHHFWGLLWEDGNLVPLDAIRLMLSKEENGYKINERFEKDFVRILIPYITAQRDKEITRLKWAQMRDDSDHDRQVARKTKRLKAFNILLDAAEKYCAPETL